MGNISALELKGLSTELETIKYLKLLTSTPATNKSSKTSFINLDSINYCHHSKLAPKSKKHKDLISSSHQQRHSSHYKSVNHSRKIK